jgi:hypothetical protein
LTLAGATCGNDYDGIDSFLLIIQPFQWNKRGIRNTLNQRARSLIGLCKKYSP